MKNEDNFEAFLYYSDNKLSISVQQSCEDSKYYEKSVVLDKDKNNLKLDKLDEFLDLNIFKIEKSLKKFIKNITLIIEHQELLKITLSLKKKKLWKSFKY